MFDVVTNAFENGGSITRDMRSLVKRAVEDAYFSGLQEGGVTSDQMDEEDAQNVVQLDLTQQDYVKPFADAVRKAARLGTAEAKNAILRRIDLWAASIAAAGQAGLNSAKANELVEFGLKPGADPSEESCSTCIKLLGKRHRRKWVAEHDLDPHPGNDNFECGGWRCPHGWNPVE